MSGTKYSAIQLERERKAQQEALTKITVLLGSIETIQKNVGIILDQIPDGVKECFSGEIKKVTDWQSKHIPSPSERMNSAELNRIVDQLQGIYTGGKEAIQKAIEVKDNKREEKERELTGKVEISKSDLAGMQTLLDKWKTGESSAIMTKLNGMHSKIDKGIFPEVQREINGWNDTLSQLRQEVTSLEELDEQRRHVLESMRKVCQEIGWDEMKQPELEDKNNPRSSIRYEVNTYSAGTMVFRLTLEGIDVNSPISKEKGACYKDFHNLSEKLKKFGVITKFTQPEAPKEEPILIEDYTLDLPDSEAAMGKEG